MQNYSRSNDMNRALKSRVATTYGHPERLDYHMLWSGPVQTQAGRFGSNAPNRLGPTTTPHPPHRRHPPGVSTAPCSRPLTVGSLSG